MNNIVTLFSLLEQKGLIPAAVPSSIFVFATLALLDPLLIIALPIFQRSLIDPLIILALITIVSVIILSFTLTAMNTYILKLFEGYLISPPLRFLYEKARVIHQNKALNMKSRRESLKNEIYQLECLKTDNTELQMKISELRGQYYEVAAAYSLHYPENLADILPTRFGNTLKAAENHAAERYGFDGVQFWPRLQQVIPADYKSSIDQTRNELSFFINLSVFSIAFSIICLVLIFHSLGKTDVVGNNLIMFFGFIANTSKYLIAAAFGFLSFEFFYTASMFSAGAFASMIRSSFDLFRLDLLEKFGLERPKNSIEEFKIWQNINELIILGGNSLMFEKIDYQKKKLNQDHSGADSDDADFNTAIYPTMRSNHNPNEKAIQLNLGGITLNMGDFTKKLLTSSRIKSARQRSKKEKTGNIKTPSKQWRKSSTKSKSGQKKSTK